MPPETEARSPSVPSSIPTGPWPIEFRGRGSELFGIHFVNGLLNVFTLGIWFAWGRIRELRFLIGSTWVAGDPMSFHGRGGELFRGVLLAFFFLIVPLYALFILGSRLTGAASALVMIAAAIGFSLLIAYVSVGALRYRLPRTEWRGIRFGFDGKPLEFLGGFIWRGALVAITLGFYHPIYSCWRRKWILSHTRFGSEYFDCDAEPRPLYRPFAVCWLLGVVTFGLSWVWYRGYLQAYLWNHSRLGNSRFTSTMTGGGWLGLQLVNAILGAVTFGFATSWIITRSHAFFFSHLTLDGALDLTAIKQRLQTTSGIGEGALDALHLESGLDLG
ncbi:MAG TPA: YjgN family protein [Candidatus Eisenbacteria bacterium]|nr:YjgN family protein [Candidatus Eisenbacteria bacterium]